MAECELGRPDVRGRELASQGCSMTPWAIMAKAIMEGMSQMVTTLSTFWVSMPTVNLASAGRSDAKPRRLHGEQRIDGLDSDAGGPRRHSRRHPDDLGTARSTAEGSAPVPASRSRWCPGLGLGVISILVIAADAFSAAIIDRSTDGKGFAESMNILVDDQPDRGRRLHPHRPGTDRV